jgi:signal transduction histidine kinase
MAGELLRPWVHPPEFPQLCAFLSERSPQPFLAVEGLTHIVRYANPAFCRLVLMDAGSLTGRPFARAVPESAANRCGELLDRAFRTGRHESLLEQPHGEIPGVYWSYLAWPILGTNGKPVGVAVQITDATEIAEFRRHMSEINGALLVSAVEQHETTEHLTDELRIAERLASLGNISAGLGHDVGNLLLPVRMRLDAIEHEPLSDPAKHDLAAIRVSFNYLQSLSNSLKLLAADPHRAVAAGGTTNFAEWWPDIRPLVRGALPCGIALEEDFPPPGSLPAAAINPTALSQAIFNLVQNAGEALAEHPATGGRVRIAAAGARGADRVRITVEDNGPGMSPEVLSRCMEPFFSTKVRRISTGMGLSIVKGLIESSGGSLRVRSEPGRGTTFIIELAAAESPDGGHAAAGARGTTQAAAFPSPAVPRRAAVTISNARAAAYLAWVIANAGAEATVHDTPSPPDADLWITEPREALTQPVRDFIRVGDRRHVIIYGEPAETGLYADVRGPLAASITVIAGSLPTPKVRPFLEQALRDLGPTPSR